MDLRCKFIMRYLSLVTLIAALTGGCVPVSISESPNGAATSTSPLLVSGEEISGRLDAFLSKLSSDPAISGTELAFSGSVLVALDNRVLLSKGYGLADRKLSLPNTAQTQFHIASLTKQFTALAILILQERGKIDVQDHACAFISNCPPAWQGITLHHLLTHTSGIPDYYSSYDWESHRGKPMTPTDLLALFIDKPLDFQPGEKWKYSNSGFVLLGMIIEQVSGMSYADFLKETLFAPLKMDNTGYLDDHENLAVGYKDDGSIQPANFEDMSGCMRRAG